MPLLLYIDWAFFDRVYMGERISNYVWCGGIILATFLLKKPLAALLARASSRVATRFSYLQHKVAIRRMLFTPMERLLQTVLYFIAINRLNYTLDRFVIHEPLGRAKPINLKLGDVIDHVFLFLFIIFLTQVITHFIDFIYYLRISKATDEKNQSRKQLLPLINEVSKMMVWLLAVFCILGYVFHVNVPALITGLGIGGVAIALAGKETVENFFASFTILSDKPFLVGETIRMGDADGLGVIEGAVERIGFRSTRLRHPDGSTYIIPNQKLVSKNIINLSTRSMTGIKITANINAGIAPAALQELIGKLKEALQHMPHVQEPVEITVDNINPETLQLSVSCQLPYPLSGNANDVKQEINFKVFDIISQYGILKQEAVKDTTT